MGAGFPGCAPGATAAPALKIGHVTLRAISGNGPGNNIGRACRSFLSRWQAHEVVGYGRAVRAGGEVGDVALQFGQGPDVPALGGVR